VVAYFFFFIFALLLSRLSRTH